MISPLVFRQLLHTMACCTYCCHTAALDDLQVGVYDPFSDDPQLGVQKIVLCCASEMLFVGGTAGQVVVLQFEQEEKEVDVKVLRCITSLRPEFCCCCRFVVLGGSCL